jgi:glucan phosphoethanolaminetransferase (alkaline phosphatase superfamily)
MPVKLRAGHGRHIDCYLTSLQKLDLFMQTLTELLANYSEDYEVLYVSDHSLRVSPMSETEKLMDSFHLPTKNIYVQPQIREAYDTPLFFISSKQQKAQKVEVPLSGFDFLHLFGNWLGVSSSGSTLQKICEIPVAVRRFKCLTEPHGATDLARYAAPLLLLLTDHWLSLTNLRIWL